MICCCPQVPKNEYGNVEFFDCCPAFLPRGAEHMRGDQIGRVAAKLGVDYAPALTGFETKQGRHVPVLDGIIVCKEQSQVKFLFIYLFFWSECCEFLLFLTAPKDKKGPTCMIKRPACRYVYTKINK